MKTNRIEITGTWDANDRINFKATETIFTGEGTLDYTMTIIASGKTEDVIEYDTEEDYFKNLYAKEGYDFYCAID